METPQTLILLVGSNPLPNLLAARALRPERIALVHTQETEPMKKRLQRLLGEEFEIDANDGFLKDSNNAVEVRRVISDLMDGPGPVHLNYTGGTKVMAAHARMAFQEAKGKWENASYLDEGGTKGNSQLRLDDGNVLELKGFPGLTVSLEEVLALHDIEHAPRKTEEPAPTPGDAWAILQATFQDIDAGRPPAEWLSKRLHAERQRLENLKKVKKAMDAPFLAENFEINLTLPQIPSGAEMTKSAFKHGYKFIGGEWLEEWVAEQIGEIGLKPAPQITVGVDSWRGRERLQLEIDIAVLRNFRTYFISCTTDPNRSLCKSKLFEIAVRSRQLGGDLARAAMVCLADAKTTAALQKNIDDVWGASNTTKVFGLEDIRKWAGAGGTPANRHSLQTWLES